MIIYVTCIFSKEKDLRENELIKITVTVLMYRYEKKWLHKISCGMLLVNNYHEQKYLPYIFVEEYKSSIVTHFHTVMMQLK